MQWKRANQSKLQLWQSPHIAPEDATLAQDFFRWRVPATESIVVTLVEGQIVRMDNLHGDSRPQGCAQGWAQ